MTVAPGIAGRGTTGGPPSPIVDRRADRAIAAGGIVAAGALLVAGVLASLLPPDLRHGIWLPLHLGIAGAASVAISAVLPFFTATLGVAPPVRPAIRTIGVTLPLIGIAAVAVGVAWGPMSLAAAGGATYLAGIGVVAYAALAPLARSAAPRRLALGLAAAAALADVAAGALLGTLYAAGWPPVLARWDLLRPAHAWLNVLGFVGLTVATTLVHLWPTVLGARIRAGRSGLVMGVGWAVGPPLVAVGLAIDSDTLARAGAAATLVGAASLAAFAILRWRARGRWTIDPAWHRTAIGHLGAGVAWGTGGVGCAAVLVLARGASPDAWSSAVLVALGVGWIAQTLVGAWTHLVPTIGPGDPVLHAAQRRILGRGWLARLVLWQLGAACLAVGVAVDLAAPSVVGGIIVGGVVVASGGLLASAVRARS